MASQQLTALLNASATSTALGIASRTGLLSVLSGTPATAASLAAAASLDPRYVEEILAVLVCGEIVRLDALCDNVKAYALEAEQRAALDSMGLYFEELPLLAQCAFDPVCDAVRTGRGVAPSNYAAFASWMAKLSREKHERQLVETFLPSLDGGAIAAQLRAGGRVADLGCGYGVAARLIAQAFPNAEVWGIDIDEASIAAARAHPDVVAGLLPNLHFACCDASTMARGADGAAADGEARLEVASCDVVLSFDAVHDLPHPAGAMASARALLKRVPAGAAGADGFVPVFAMVDIRAQSCVSDNVAHPMAPFLYAVSLLHCLPQGLNDKPPGCGEPGCRGEGLGMMWGREKALAMLVTVGFASVEVVDMPFDSFNSCYLCK